MHCDEDVRIHSDTRGKKRVLHALRLHSTTGVPYTHTSNTLCEIQTCVVEQNLPMKQENIKDCVPLVPSGTLTMKSQGSSVVGFSPNQLFHVGAFP